MAYTLKSSGIALNLISCVGVDEDGTIIDFVGNGITLGTGVAASVTSSTWKGTTRSYFETTANGSFDFHGVRFNATVPAVDEDDADGCSVFIACAGASASSNDGPFVCIAAGDSNNRGLSRQSGTNKGTYVSGGTVALTTTDLPTNGTTKFGFGMAYRSGNSSEAYYGPESGSMSQEDTEGSDGGFGGDRSLWNIGGSAGNGNQPFKPFIVAVFNKKLSTAEMQSLHGDGTDTWITTLFNAGGGGGSGLSVPRNISLLTAVNRAANF
jgi:hypothetical protein